MFSFYFPDEYPTEVNDNGLVMQLFHSCNFVLIVLLWLIIFQGKVERSGRPETRHECCQDAADKTGNQSSFKNVSLPTSSFRSCHSYIVYNRRDVVELIFRDAQENMKKRLSTSKNEVYTVCGTRQFLEELTSVEETVESLQRLDIQFFCFVGWPRTFYLSTSFLFLPFNGLIRYLCGSISLPLTACFSLITATRLLSVPRNSSLRNSSKNFRKRVLAVRFVTENLTKTTMSLS